MDSKVYCAKKVSRQERDADSSEDEDDSEDEGEEEGEEDQSGEEEGEVEMDDDSEELDKESAGLKKAISSSSSEADYVKREKVITDLTTSKADKQVDDILNQLKSEAKNATAFD